jgi:hypothetical protein
VIAFTPAAFPNQVNSVSAPPLRVPLFPLTANATHHFPFALNPNISDVTRIAGGICFMVSPSPLGCTETNLPAEIQARYVSVRYGFPEGGRKLLVFYLDKSETEGKRRQAG